MQKQLTDAWCWAAVGTSAALYYNPDSAWTQCKIVEQSLMPTLGNCCNNPENFECNKPFYLINDKRPYKGSFVTAHIPSSFVSKPFEIDELLTEISNGRVVAYRMEIGLSQPMKVSPTHSISSFFHFVVIAGYEIHSKPLTSKSLYVYVFDSFSLEEGYSLMSYETFLHNYKSHGGSIQLRNSDETDEMTFCRITHSFYVNK